jgi:hypothetical protein
MSLEKLRRFDVQGKWALILSSASIPPFAAAVLVGLKNYDAALGQIVYGSAGRFVIAFLGCVAVSVLPATLGCALGWSSAGQRRNDRPGSSWFGFFVGGFIVTMDLILVIAFLMLRLKIPMNPS